MTSTVRAVVAFKIAPGLDDLGPSYSKHNGCCQNKGQHNHVQNGSLMAQIGTRSVPPSSIRKLFVQRRVILFVTVTAALVGSAAPDIRVCISAVDTVIVI